MYPEAKESLFNTALFIIVPSKSSFSKKSPKKIEKEYNNNLLMLQNKKTKKYTEFKLR